MRKIFFTFIAFLPSIAFAQTNTFQSFFDKYAGHDGFTTVKISPKMFDLIASAEIEDEDLSVIKDITGVNLLAYEPEEGTSNDRADKLYAETKSLVNSGYYELMSVKDESTDLKILAKSAEQGIVNDLLIVGKDDGEFIFVNVLGKIDIKKISSLSKCSDIKGLDHLEELEDKDKK